MKNLLYLLFLLFPFTVVAQNNGAITGEKHGGAQIRISPTDAYNLGYADFQNGGYHTSPTKTGRDSLISFYPTLLRQGMLDYVVATDTTYRYLSGAWVAIGAGNLLTGMIQNKYGVNTVQANSKISVSDSIKTTNAIIANNFSTIGENNFGSSYTVSSTPNNIISNHRGIDSYVGATFTTSPYNGYGVYGIHSAVEVGSTNTQNWTALDGALGSFLGSVRTATGAIGTLASTSNILLTGRFRASGMNITEHNYITILPTTGAGAGNVTNEAGLFIYTLNKAANTSYIVTGVDTTTSAHPTGNWNIYSNTAYPNYLGTGLTTLGSIKSNGQASYYSARPLSLLDFLYKQKADSLYATSSSLSSYILLPGSPSTNDALRFNGSAWISSPITGSSGVSWNASTWTMKADTATIQTVANFFPKGDTRYPTIANLATNYVPYSGATGSLNMGTNSILSSAIALTGSAGSGAYVNYANSTTGGLNTPAANQTNAAFRSTSALLSAFYKTSTALTIVTYKSNVSNTYNYPYVPGASDFVLTRNDTSTVKNKNLADASNTFRTWTSSDLSNTGVTPGSYTNANITVGSDGRITLASNGSAGGVTSVSGTANRITSTGGSTPVIDISSSYVGQSSITTLGTISTGTWQGSVIAPSYIGSGTAAAGKYVDGGTGAWATIVAPAGTLTGSSLASGVTGSSLTSLGTLNGLTESGTSAVTMANTSSGLNPQIATFFAPNATATATPGNGGYVAFGTAFSTQNAGVLQFQYVGAGSNSNYINFGIIGTAGPFNIFKDRVSIGTTTQASTAGSLLVNANVTSASLNVTGTTTLATSLSGLLKTALGVVSAATANTDYLTPSYTGFDSRYLVNPITTLGDIIYGGASGAATRLAGNITSTQKFLTQTGTGSVSAAPAYFDLFGTANNFLARQSFSDGTQGLQIGAYTAGGGNGAIYPYGVTPGSSNYAFSASATLTELNNTTVNIRAATTANILIGGVNYVTVNSSGISLNGSALLNVGTPFSGTDGVNKNYVDAHSLPSGLDGQIVSYYDGGVPLAIGRLSVQNAKTIFTPTTGGTVNLNNNYENIIKPSGTLATLTLNLPSSPSDGDTVNLTFTQAVTAITYSGGTVVGAPASAAATGQYHLTFDVGSSTWY